MSLHLNTLFYQFDFSQGPNLDVVYLEVNEQLAAWTFAPLQDYIPQITCLVPFNQNKNFQRSVFTALLSVRCLPSTKTSAPHLKINRK